MTIENEETADVSNPVERLVSSFYDSLNNEIKEFDVVKVFHFTGARRKKHYMYKWIRKDSKGKLCFCHLDSDKEEMIWLSVVCKSTLKGYVWQGAEVVQSNDC